MKQVIHTIKSYPYLAFYTGFGMACLLGGIKLLAMLDAYKIN